jgi:hypothetical protein
MNKKIPIIFILLLLGIQLNAQTYYNGLVEVSSYSYYDLIKLNRKDNHIKVKYFASQKNGKSVVQRYNEWAKGKKVIFVSSGTYTDDYSKPVGLTLDDGNLVNNTFKPDCDGLVIVYATGGMVVSNLKNGDLTLVGGGIAPGRKLDIRGNAWDLADFKTWCQSQSATVFQTHLLAFKNQSLVGYNCSQKNQERRALAVGYNSKGDLIHLLINYNKEINLNSFTSDALRIVKSTGDIQNLVYIVNLDRGSYDILSAFNESGYALSIKGEESIDIAVNLIAYYYE